MSSRASPFAVVLVEELAQREFRPFAAIRHDRRQRIGLAVDPNGDPLFRWRAILAFKSLLSSLAWKSLVALAPAWPDLPSRPWAWPRLRSSSDEPRCVLSDHIKRIIAFVFLVCAAHVEPATV